MSEFYEIPKAGLWMMNCQSRARCEDLADRDTQPTVEELRKRRAPAAVKAAMGVVESMSQVNEMIKLRDNATINDRPDVVRALTAAIDSKRKSILQGLETLEDIGRELDE